MTDHADDLPSALSQAGAGLGSPRLTDEIFLELRRAIAEASGIAFDERSRFILERRLLPRLRALRFESFEQYARYLLRAPEAAEEVGRMLEQVVIRETYFFREPQQFDAFWEEVLPRLARRNETSRRLRIWSAGCASGEEPYTIAMLVLVSELFPDWRVEILGTDLSPSAIQAARRGVFRGGSMRGIPEDFKARFFDVVGETSWRIDDSVRRLVSFETFNLIDARRYERYSGVDAIFCRNVLIYLGADARQVVVNGFHAALRDGGFLLLGHAEALAGRTTPFKVVRLRRDLAYQK
jgi:chemotaxis protein methyltransferase CheR